MFEEQLALTMIARIMSWTSTGDCHFRFQPEKHPRGIGSGKKTAGYGSKYWPTCRFIYRKEEQSKEKGNDQLLVENMAVSALVETKTI
ncbi:hypothetical protein RUM44_002185 [Polyplax serrata]|uniref:Uncharacterized protein n=1 Tax=Polyplax serrata TaxID=468196 RepID=A0ABR1ANP0_POLSC